MFSEKYLFIGLVLFAALLLGVGLFYLLTRFMNKLFKISKNPDELENLIILEAKNKVATYYLCALFAISILLSDRWGIESDSIRNIVFVFILCGMLFERVAMKTISKRFAKVEL